MSTSEDCLFCSFAAGDGPDFVAENEFAVAFRDINPQAPTHVLVIPRRHYANVADLAAADPQALAGVIALAHHVARTECGGEYRLIFNSGEEAGQSVFHAHGHILGGTKLGWSPA